MNETCFNQIPTLLYKQEWSLLKVVTLDLFCKGYVHCYFAYISNTSKACWSIHQKQKKARYVSCNRKEANTIQTPKIARVVLIDWPTFRTFRYIGLILKYRFWLFRFCTLQIPKQSQKRKPIIQSISSVGFDKWDGGIYCFKKGEEMAGAGGGGSSM